MTTIDPKPPTALTPEQFRTTYGRLSRGLEKLTPDDQTRMVETLSATFIPKART